MRSEYNKFVSKHLRKEMEKGRGKSPTSAMKAVSKLWQKSKKRSGSKKSKRSARSKKSKRSC